MKLSQFKGPEAYDVLAELMEPVGEICADPEIRKTAQEGSKLKTAKALIKNHGESINKILAILNREDPETYAPNLAQILLQVMDLLNDEELLRLFQ